MARLWPDLPHAARTKFIRAAGRQWFDLWRSGAELDTFPPAVWGWRVTNAGLPLAVPTGIFSTAQKPIARSRATRSLAIWLHAPTLPFGERDRLRLLVAFADAAAMPRGIRRKFAAAVSREARRDAQLGARALYLDVQEETNHLCRQSVDCRGVWLPDSRRSADEFRHDIEQALRLPDATHIKHSDVAQVTRTRMHGEDVVIKRHRFAKTGKRLKYLWRMSRARRAWAAGLTLQRLGLPVAEPLGFLEVMRNGRVADSYIIVRWLPACRTAREIANEPTTPANRRRAIATWRTAWLDLLARGIYHADTKLSNALVQTTGPRPVIHWIDLECVLIGRPLTPYRILRNIVQMTGSLPRTFPLRDRIRFLTRLPPHLRWLRSLRCNRIIAWWTNRRLGAEKRGAAGP